MERIAIISDIHGNLEALKTVLKDIEKRKIKRIFCLGDIIGKGINASQCLKLIKENCEVILRGNNDEFFCSDLNIDEFPQIEQKRIKWNKNLLSSEEQKFLLSLPYCYEFYMSGSLIRLFHATPNKINGFISNLDTLENKRKLFMPSNNTITDNIADVVIYGHIHLQYMDKMYNRTIVNVGSVGNPIEVVRNENFDANVKETTKASYLIIEGNYDSRDYDDSLSFQFIKLPYNIEKELETNEKNIEKDSYSHEIKEGKYRDFEKLKKSFIKRKIEYNKF